MDIDGIAGSTVSQKPEIEAKPMICGIHTILCPLCGNDHFREIGEDKFECSACFVFLPKSSLLNAMMARTSR